MGMRTGRAFSAVFAALLTAPLAAVGVCRALVPFAASPRTPAPDRCATCGAAAYAQLAREQDGAAPTKHCCASK